MYRLRSGRWEKLYDLQRDGADICTFYSKVNNGRCCFTTSAARGYSDSDDASNKHKADPQVIVVKDTRGRVFGGLLASEHWHPSSRYFGSGESFVFSFDDDGVFHPFGWTGANEKRGGDEPSRETSTAGTAVVATRL